MPLAQVRFPTISGQGCAAAGSLDVTGRVSLAPLVPNYVSSTHGLAVFVLSATLLIAGCSSPKTGAVSAAKPAAGVVETPVRSTSSHPEPNLQSDPFIAAVRAARMSGYPQSTIGQAFETAFSNAHWDSQQPQGGARVVIFTGLLPAKMRPECGAAKAGPPASPCAQNAKVTFEWTFASDGRLFHLSNVDPEPWPETHRSTREMMLYIFG